MPTPRPVLYLLLLGAFGLGSAAHAQDLTLRGYGVKAGYTSARLSTAPVFDADPYVLLGRAGFHAAVFAEWQLVEAASLVTQMGYT